MALENYVITLPPPTANGGLHLGHITGPFLAADVFAKYHRLNSHRCTVTSYSDVNQSYVRVTAERQGREPSDLARFWTEDIRETLEIYGSDVHEFYYPDEGSEAFVRDIFLQLYREGKIKIKAIPAFYSIERAAFLDEAGVSGYCPHCLAACKWGICEACGFTNDARSLLLPHDTVTKSEALEIRQVDVLVFEMEEYRSAINEFYGSNRRFRPRYLSLVTKALAQPLPDFPITFPGEWGIPLNHPDLPGQVINAWAEVMAHLLWCYNRADSAETQPKVVNFFGYDNSYFYGIVHVALLVASEQQKWLPYATVINEFYNLDHRKFSTSNNHVVWARDLSSEFSPDVIRFYAAYNSPGFEKANFSRAGMENVVRAKLIEPWHKIATHLQILVGDRSGPSETASPVIVNVGRSIIRRIGESYSLEGFHLRQAAEDILHLLAFALEGLGAGRLGAADALFLVKCLAQAIYPIMPVAGQELYRLVAGKALETSDLSPNVRLTLLPQDIFEISPTIHQAEEERCLL